MLHGWYRLRIVSTEHPNPGVGGMYLTLGPHGEVVVEAMGPHNFEAQKWHVQPVNGGTDVYVIVRRAPHEGLREGLEDASEVPVVFGPDPEEWRITGDDESVYLISPNKKYPIGVEHLVGADDDRKVVVKVFPVYPGDRPAWKFERVDD